MELVYLALGANLGDPLAQIAAALEALEAPDLRVERRARIYRSAPVGPPGQPDYLNSAIEVRTALEPLALLDRVKAVEAELGRTAGVRWGPRVIDIDLALYGDREVDHARLRIPHAQLVHRAFVLAPLADLCPSRRVPGTEHTIAELLERLNPPPEELSVLDAPPWTPSSRADRPAGG